MPRAIVATNYQRQRVICFVMKYPEAQVTDKGRDRVVITKYNNDGNIELIEISVRCNWKASRLEHWEDFLVQHLMRDPSSLM